MKPCPKCGSDGALSMGNTPSALQNKIESRVHCYACGFDGPLRDTDADAILAWDALHPDEPSLTDMMRKLPPNPLKTYPRHISENYVPFKSRFVKLKVVEYDNSKSIHTKRGSDWLEEEYTVFNPSGVWYKGIYVDRLRVVDISPGEKNAISREHGYGDVDWPDEPATSYIGLDTNTGGGRLVLGTIEEVKEMLE